MNQEENKVDVDESTNQQPEATEEKQPETPEENPAESNPEETVDYLKTKFSESSKEALRLLEENKATKSEIEQLRKELEAKEAAGSNYGKETENLYPGFEMLTEEEQRNVQAYTDGIKKSVLEGIYKDPAISDARASHNERRWETAFQETVSEYPELAESKDEFKTKYFRADNVPSNINEITKDLAKVFLFDRARDLGAKDATEKANRIEIERANGGDKTPKASRTIEDWQKLQQDNPAEFAKLSKQFNEDMNSGQMK